MTEDQKHLAATFFPTAMRIARASKWWWHDPDAAESAAGHALCLAAVAYKESSGASFNTYAGFRVSHAVRRDDSTKGKRGKVKSIGLDIQKHDSGRDEAEAQDARLFAQEVLDVLDELSPEQAETVTRRYIDGQSCIEIAREMGVTEGTAHVRLRQAIALLKERFRA